MKASALRNILLGILVVAVMLGCTLRLARYQIVDGATYRTQAKKVTLQSVSVTAPRGEILDRYGRVIATSKIGYEVYLQSSIFPSDKKAAQVNGILRSLCDVLQEKGESWNDTLPISKTAPYAFTAGSDAQIKKLRTLLNDNQNLSADALMQKLIKKYSLQSYTQDQQRTLAGIRFGMDVEEFRIAGTYAFADSVSMDTVTKIKERSSALTGVAISEVPTRVYVDGTVAPHVIGSVGPIYASEYQALKKKGYNMNEIVGKTGIEKSMESYLRGVPGKQTMEVDENGNAVSGSVTSTAKPGDNVVLTIDSNLQKLVQSSLEATVKNIAADAHGSVQNGANAKSGAAVVLDIKTGELLAMASYPSYDINTYQQNYSQLVSDSTRPLFDRCVSGAYRPGSTFKPITALSALMNGTITAGSRIYCPASFTVGTGSGAYTGWDDEHRARGAIDVVTALSVSSNVFFYQVGQRVGISKLVQTANIFGIGQRTGIELPAEASGTMSSPDEKQTRGSSWYPADIVQASIGQLDTTITPIQLASYVSTLVKYGERDEVHVVRTVKTYDNSKTLVDNSTAKVVSKTDLPKNLVDVVRVGMRTVAESGTASSVFNNYQITIGGKTGTAQVPKGYNGVFVAFAPYDDPEYAVAVVVENGHNGYQTAPVAKDAFNYLFSINGQTPNSLSTASAKQNQLLQ